ncbi:MAG: carnitine 3-dehydrogenase, partial [Rhodobacteraceae bacterium]|nr:carnitine 3-dehydrogenase [Paracoccaceae bacterium]
KLRNWGAGAVLAKQDQRLVEKAGMARTVVEIADLSQPILTQRRVVPVDWLDYNGHMTESRYLQAVTDATDRFMEIIGCDAEYIANGGSFFTAETHIRHLGEVHVGDVIEVRTQVLMAEGKKMHLWNEISAGGELVATGEQMLIHVSLETRRPAVFSPEIAANLEAIATAQAGLPEPEGKGRAVGAPR